MTERWRLVNGKELYDIKADPGQTSDVAGAHPDTMRALTNRYDAWWESLKPTFDRFVRIGLGADADNPTRLMSHDWVVKDQKNSPWHQQHVSRRHLASGPWAVRVQQDGNYRFELCRWPKHLDRAMDCTLARLKIGSIDVQKEIDPGDTCATFVTELNRGPAMLQTWLTNADGNEHGAYFVWVTRLD
jgi:arylsulfatase B